MQFGGGAALGQKGDKGEPAVIEPVSEFWVFITLGTILRLVYKYSFSNLML